MTDKEKEIEDFIKMLDSQAEPSVAQRNVDEAKKGDLSEFIDIDKLLRDKK